MIRFSKRRPFQSTIPPAIGTRTFLYAACGLILGAALTVGGYLVDYHGLYGALPPALSPGVVQGLHDITPVHYFADLLALILAIVGGFAGWLQDRVVFYSNMLEELVGIRTKELQRSEESYALAVEGSNDGIWDWNVATDEVYYSPRWKSMTGHAAVEIGDRPEEWLDLVHPDDLGRVRETLRGPQDGARSHFQVDYRMRQADGSYRWMLARGVAVRDQEGKPTRLAGSQTDIHDRRRTEDQLRYLAVHDKLTGLPNRALLADRMGRILDRRSSRTTKAAVLHLGIDRFKKINESFGQQIGDRLLIEVGARLGEAVGDFESAASSSSNGSLTGSVFRVEGDEFVVVLEDVRSLRDATRLAEKILRSLEGPLHLEDREILLSMSIGITLGPQGNRDIEEILRDAQTAMHRAKVQGRARFEVFDREMIETVQEELHLETELFQAMEARQFQLWYQPIFALASREIVGFEALARWPHRDRGLIAPGKFIPLAEETGQIVRLSEWLFEDAFLRLNRWQEVFEDRQDLAINVNLSPKYLFHVDLENHLGSLLRKTNVNPSRIHLEITESILIDRPHAAAKILRRLKKWGFRLALDDFGTGFSSLSMLHELPFDILKIDQQFVSKLSSEPEVRKIVRTIVNLARELDLDVVAEGIETEPQMRELSSMSCDFGQGSLLGRPMTVEAAEKLIRPGGKKLRSSTAEAR